MSHDYTLGHYTLATLYTEQRTQSTVQAEAVVEATALTLAELAIEQGATSEYLLKGDDLERLASALGRPATRDEGALLLCAMRALLPPP